jgi:hypothetical protein
MQREEGGDAANVVGEGLGFVAGEGATEEGLLAVAEPLLEDLVAAEGVVSDGFGNVLPTGGGVEVDVEEALATGAGGDLAGAGHGDTVLTGVAPTGVDGEVWREECLGLERSAFDGTFRIEQGGVWRPKSAPARRVATVLGRGTRVQSFCRAPAFCI